MEIIENFVRQVIEYAFSSPKAFVISVLVVFGLILFIETVDWFTSDSHSER